MPKRKISNPLALAVLASLLERPMHPYELASTLRERGKEQSVKLNYGTLYTVVEALQRDGLITPQETLREGRRPERTVYRIEEAGRTELRDWLRELLGRPVKEYPQFMAGLSFAGVLPPDEAAEVLRERERLLAEQVERLRSTLAGYLAGSADRPPLPRIFLVEHDYELALLEADLGFTRRLLRDIDEGTLDGLRLWASFHAGEEGAARAP
jgi:DNA-binding PadR family transcriptional regulator